MTLRPTTLAAALLLTAALTVSAQSTVVITGTGSGSLSGVAYANKAFTWTISFTTANPYLNWGADQPIYTILSSQINIAGVNPAITVTASEGFFAGINFTTFTIAPIRMNNGSPGANILSIAGSPGWDGVSSMTSTRISSASFTQFANVATDQGTLTMNSGSVTLLQITGAAVPEPGSLALAALGAAGLVCFRHRRR